MTLMVPLLIKTDEEKLDYGFDYSEELTEVSDSISSSNWVMDDDLTQSSDSHTTYKSSVFIAGGTTGNTYLITNKIETSQGRIYEKFFNLKIEAP